MMVVSIIGILASIAMPKFADLLRKAQEGSAKGNLGTVRSGLNILYADTNGAYPACAPGTASTVFSVNLVPRYLTNLQPVKTGLHVPTNNVYCDSALTAGSVHDGQGWYYNGDATDSAFGSVYIACDHTDSKGSFWTSY